MADNRKRMKGVEETLALGGAFPQASTPAAAFPAARRLIVIAGFPGAGKTMLASRLGLHLKRKGARVRMLLQDHQRQLADLALLRADGFRQEEIATGCENTSLDEAEPPQVLIAEAAQSFGNGTASAIDPFRPCLGNGGNIAPLSVVIDPVRAGRVFGLEPGGTFSSRLASLYRQQLAEAELIVLNKCDLLSAESLEKLTETIERELPRSVVCAVSVRTGEGLDEWFQCLMSKEHTPDQPAPAAQEDEAEALLASLNCTIKLSSVKYWDSGKLLMEIATGIQSLLREEGAEVAHLKMVLTPLDELGEIAALNVIRNDLPPVLSRQISEPIQTGELLLNLKAEADPECLHAALNKALLTVVEKHSHLFLRMEHCEHFRLGSQL